MNENDLIFEKYMESKSPKVEKQTEFFETRKAGAAKIAKTAQEKGGPSILTAWHFKIKDAEYKKVLNLIETEKDLSTYKSHCDALLAKIDVDKMSQKEFQQVMGQLEVWGESYIKVKENQS